MSQALTKTDLGLPGKRQGKVRDLYDVTLDDGTEALLIIATDRISVFDVVLGNGIPGKGVLLTQISSFWFNFFAADIKHHLISTDVNDVPGLSDNEREMLAGRIMLSRKTKVIPVECIVRGYLTGSGFKEYQRCGSVCGIELLEGMVNSDRIAEPIFTPSTKPEQGHDENISFEEATRIAGDETMQVLMQKSLSIYTRGRDYAAERGIIIADTKFEFGQDKDGDIVLIDEVLTPDSSRFWPADSYAPGGEQDSFDKQYVRNYTEELVSAGTWNKEYPGPSLPDEVIESTLTRYREALSRLTG